MIVIVARMHWWAQESIRRNSKKEFAQPRGPLLGEGNFIIEKHPKPWVRPMLCTCRVFEDNLVGSLTVKINGLKAVPLSWSQGPLAIVSCGRGEASPANDYVCDVLDYLS